MNINHHEALYRGPKSMSRLQGRLVTVCGAGALGANLTESLARAGVDTLRVIDFDRIEEHNLSTQPYELDDIGAQKATTLAHALYRAVGCEVEAITKRLTEQNVRKLLQDSDLVIDCFDNGPSRHLVTAHCKMFGQQALHAGMADGFGEVIWNDDYRVPAGGVEDICDYPLARNLVMMTASVAAEMVLRYLIDGSRENWSLTLRDLSLRPLQMA